MNSSFPSLVIEREPGTLNLRHYNGMIVVELNPGACSGIFLASAVNVGRTLRMDTWAILIFALYKRQT